MMKRRILKSLLSIVMICSLFSFNIFIANAAYNEALAAQGIEITNTKYSKTVKTEMSKKITISESNLSSLKKDLEKQNLTKYEQNVAILKELGFEDITISHMIPEDVEKLFDNALSVDMNTTYIKSNADGTTSTISEEECLKAVAEAKALRTNSNEVSTIDSANDGWNAYTSDDGYMRVTVSSIYTDPATKGGEKGWYSFHAWYEWLQMPKQRRTDAISLYAAECSWAQESDATYSSRGYDTDEGGYSEHHSASKVTVDCDVNSHGVFYTWDMPTETNVTYIQYYLRGNGVVAYPQLDVNFNVYARYEHVYNVLDIDIEFTWSTSDPIPGVEYTGGIVPSITTYGIRNITQYKPNNT